MLIGKRIKELRQQKKITLSDLSRKSGVQIATLSRIENQKMIGTIDSHQNIARALGLEITDLYANVSNIREVSKVTPSLSPSESFTYNKTASYEMLTSNLLSKKMMPILLKVEPNGKTNVEQNKRDSERFIFVIEGEITAHIGERTFPLTPTNTLYFDASEKHWFSNEGSSVARLLSVTTPVEL